jgi:threonine aldolase
MALIRVRCVRGLVDLRSDTVTRPTATMRRAMADADVGDDGYGEDPTVNELEATYAARVGKEAALYVPSGTMANQLALRVLASPGTLVVSGRRQHVVVHECGAAARNAGIQFHPVDDATGVVTPDDVQWARTAEAHHQPVVGLVCIENTHMAACGAPWPVERLDALRAAAGGIPIHMDGARLFNAEVATGVAADRLAAPVTTVMTCLSKGLCAPVGSLLAGPDQVVAAARLERRRLGGAMRQAGVIAAAGLVALRSMVTRLADDHARASRLAEAVAERWPDAGCDPATVRTNIVCFTHRDPVKVLDHLRQEGVLAGTIAPGVLRLVTHHDVDDDAIGRAVKVVLSSPL